MIKYITLTDEFNKYELSALIKEDGCYELPSLFFKESGLLWDNEYFLYEEVLPFLNGQLPSNCDSDLHLHFKDDMNKTAVRELFEEALRLGFF